MNSGSLRGVAEEVKEKSKTFILKLILDLKFYTNNRTELVTQLDLEPKIAFHTTVVLINFKTRTPLLKNREWWNRKKEMFYLSLVEHSRMSR